jgi:signal transduction histidine kinase/DNA-binding response OmpR family regulator
MSKIGDRSAAADDKGSPGDMAAVPLDKTALLKTEILQNAILNSADFAIIATDAKGIIQLFNIGAERMLGYAADDVVNKRTLDDFNDPQQLIDRAKALSTEFATTVTPGFDALTFKASRGIEDAYELDYIRKDGSRFPTHGTITALRDERNGIIGYLKIGIDNSARVAVPAADPEKRSVDKKEQSVKADEEKQRLKDEFVATVSHELRTPLTSIAGALGLLNGNAAGKLPDSAKRLLAIAYTNSQRLVRLLNDILDIEKMESGKVVFDFKRVEVRSLVAQTIKANRALAEGFGVRIRLVAACAAVDVRVDPDRLVQAVTNLLSNAIKFSPPSKEVVVAVEARNESVRISVRDHGHGVPDEFKPRIFEKFAQADATDARQKGGTGLGLSIVKEIVDRLDGSVGFGDAPGGGAIFHVDLPNWARAVRLQSRLVRKADLRVLLCEDNPEASIVLFDRLRQEGFLADVALTANEAVARVAATSYAAILVDLQLPEGDGVSLIKQLRAQPQIYNTLLVVLSADLDPAHDETQPSTLLNILDWLDTPIDVARLVRVLDRPIARNGKTRPRILHVDSDAELLRAVAAALGAGAEVMSVASIDEARRALAANRFDVAVLDVALAAGSGFELLHELRDGDGDAIPLVVFSPHDANPVFAVQVRAALTKSRTSIDNLIATLCKRFADNSSSAGDKDVA